MFETLPVKVELETFAIIIITEARLLDAHEIKATLVNSADLVENDFRIKKINAKERLTFQMKEIKRDVCTNATS